MANILYFNPDAGLHNIQIYSTLTDFLAALEDNKTGKKHVDLVVIAGGIKSTPLEGTLRDMKNKGYSVPVAVVGGENAQQQACASQYPLKLALGFYDNFPWEHLRTLADKGRTILLTMQPAAKPAAPIAYARPQPQRAPVTPAQQSIAQQATIAGMRTQDGRPANLHDVMQGLYRQAERTLKPEAPQLPNRPASTPPKQPSKPQIKPPLRNQ